MFEDIASTWTPPAWTSETSTHRYFVVDAFTNAPLEGNQVAIFLDCGELPGELMQPTARELNLSETVFVLDPEAGGDARIRIFTPAEELPFAGHPVLGSAILLGEMLEQDVVRLETGAGIVPVEVHRQRDRASFGWMAQPIPTWDAYPHATDLLSALGVEGSGLPVEAYDNGPLHVYVELDDEAAVSAVQPDFPALAELGVCASCFAGAGHSWKTRMFAPALGVNEDPATGSAAGPLAVHLARHSRTRFGQDIEIRQGEEIGRPSLLHARALGTPEKVDRVAVGGAAVVVARGQYRIT